MTIDLTDPIFHDADKAREWLEQARWPNGVNCVHCGGLRVALMGGKKHRPQSQGTPHAHKFRVRIYANQPPM